MTNLHYQTVVFCKIHAEQILFRKLFFCEVGRKQGKIHLVGVGIHLELVCTYGFYESGFLEHVDLSVEKSCSDISSYFFGRFTNSAVFSESVGLSINW